MPGLNPDGLGGSDSLGPLRVDELSIGGDGPATSFADISSGSGLSEEEVEDVINGLLAAGDKITLSYDDAGNSLQIGTNALDTEEVQDAINAALSGDSTVSTSYDDANGVVTLSVANGGITETKLSFDPATQGELDTHAGTVDVHHARYSDEEVQDVVNTLLSAGDVVTLSYDDVNNTLTVDIPDGSITEAKLAFDAATASEVFSGNPTDLNQDGASDGQIIQWDSGTGSWTVAAPSSGATELQQLNDVTEDTLANLPASGSAGDWYLTTDSNGIYHDPDGTGFVLIAEHPSNIGASDLGFDPATQTELNNHATATDNPHSVTASQTGALEDAAGTVAESNLSFDTATQTELNTHAGTTDVHHSKTTSGEIDHDTTQNYVANEHVDHSSVSVSSGTGLTGGGDLTSSRTLSFDTAGAATGDHLYYDGASLGWEAPPSGGSGGTPDTQALADGNLVALAAGSRTTVDPSGTATPLQDAAAAIDAATGALEGGTIFLPPTTVTESAGEIPPNTFQNVNIIGCGINSSRVEFTDTTANGVHLDPNDSRQCRQYWTDFTLDGSDAQTGSRSGSAIAVTGANNGGGVWGFNIGRMGFRNWAGPVIHVAGSGGWFSSQIEYLDFRQDSSNYGVNIQLDTLGPGMVFQQLDLASETQAKGIVARNSGSGVKGDLNITAINTFTGVACALDCLGIQNWHMEIGTINAEPKSAHISSTPVNAAVELDDRGWKRIGAVQTNNIEYNSIVELGFNNGRNVIGYLHARTGTINDNKLSFSHDSHGFDAPSYYFGPESEVSRNGNTAYINTLGNKLRVASGSVTLSGGAATVDTGVGSGTTATFDVSLGPATDDADVGAEIRAASGGNYEVDIVESPDTSVGNPTVEYDIYRVR